MFILYGWGVRTTKRCGVKNDRCIVCKNDKAEYFRVKVWFTLFFIPLIPYATEYYKCCTRCGQRTRLKRAEFLDGLNRPDTALEPLPPDEIDQQDLVMREITVVRENIKRLKAVKVCCLVDGISVCSVANGETARFTVDNRRHSLVVAAGEDRSNVVFIEADKFNKKYQINIKIGANCLLTIVLADAEPTAELSVNG